MSKKILKFQEEKTSWAECDGWPKKKVWMKNFLIIFFCILSKFSHTLEVILKIKKFLSFSTKNFFFCCKTWLRCSRKKWLTIFISLMVAIDLTKRFIRTTAGPSKDLRYIDFSKYIKDFLNITNEKFLK